MQASLHSSAPARRAAAVASSASASVSSRPLLPLLASNNNRPSTSTSAASSALPWHREQQNQSQQQIQQQQSRRRGLALSTRRAAAATGLGGNGGNGGGNETDPYKVLGIPPDADNNAINRAFRVKKFEARGNDAETARLEAAHSALMMAALAQRVRGAGAGAVPAEVRFADREPLFPWRPKRWDATPKVVLAMGAIQLAVAFFGFQSPQFSKIVGAGLIGVAGNVLKANAISPPPRNPETATEEEQGRSGRNFVRGLLLGLMATVGGMLIFSLPEVAVNSLGLALPAWVPTGPAVTLSVRIAGVAFCNWLITSYFY
jgi:hypothetical protein